MRETCIGCYKNHFEFFLKQFNALALIFCLSPLPVNEIQFLGLQTDDHME